MIMVIFKTMITVILIKEITELEKHFRDQMKISSLNLLTIFKCVLP